MATSETGRNRGIAKVLVYRVHRNPEECRRIPVPHADEGGFDGSNESHVGLPGTGLLPDHWMWILEDCFPSTVAATVNTGLKEPPEEQLV
jgi:hypothetical protein